jgi:hypothetical protein
MTAQVLRVLEQPLLLPPTNSERQRSFYLNRHCLMKGLHALPYSLSQEKQVTHDYSK